MQIHCDVGSGRFQIDEPTAVLIEAYDPFGCSFDGDVQFQRRVGYLDILRRDSRSCSLRET